MAYLDRTDARSRATAIIGVGAMHALLAAGLILGLTVVGYRTTQPRIVGVALAPEPPPPPAPQPTQTEVSTQNFKLPMPLPLVPLPEPSPTVSSEPVPIQPYLIPTPTPSAEISARPSPTPSFAPKSAVPRGNPGSWITTDDYPLQALRMGVQGLARYRLTIAADGKVAGCEITGSSGSPDLDRETCHLLSRRAQFDPATDQTGAKVASSYSGNVRWTIPN